MEDNPLALDFLIDGDSDHTEEIAQMINPQKEERQEKKLKKKPATNSGAIELTHGSHELRSLLQVLIEVPSWRSYFINHEYKSITPKVPKPICELLSKVFTKANEPRLDGETSSFSLSELKKLINPETSASA